VRTQVKGFCTAAITLWLGALLGALLVGCTPPTAKADLQAVAQGKQLYHALACDSCHGLDAVGSKRTYAPTHNHLRATAEQRIHAPNYTGKAKTATEYIRESVVEPKAYVVDGYEHVRFGMPSFAYLSEREVNALVQFLYHQE
jgi:mono/diheme cytochrome c family protein